MTKPVIGIASDVQHIEGKRDYAFTYLTYVEAIRRAGGIPVLVPPQPENAADVVEGLDGLVLAGGEDCNPALYGQERHPTVTRIMDERRQTNDAALAKAARQHEIPTLGICLGMQMMNVAAGGTLVQDIDDQIGTEIQHASKPEKRARHDVIVDEGTKLASLLPATEFNINSSHHQAIGQLGEGLTITAHAPDGIVEGLEDPRHPFYVGVQWHPEDMPGEKSAEMLFEALVGAARHYSQQRRPQSVAAASE